jgi:hypothetical protein
MSTNLNLKSTNIPPSLDHSYLQNTIFAQTKIKSYEIELKKIWSYFIKSFELDKFYDETTFNGKPKFHHSTHSRIKAIQMLNEFFKKNKIYYSENFSLICQNERLIREEKIWIMYIVIMGQTLEIFEIQEIFKNALRNEIDPIILFEFFLIFISKFNSECFQSFLTREDNFLPEEFLQIYQENKHTLNKLFEMQNSFNMSYSNNSQQSYNEFSFYTKYEETEVKIDLEGVKSDYTRTTDYDIDKTIDERMISMTALEQDKMLMKEILEDEMIDETKLNDKSPIELSKHIGKKFETEQKFKESSPTLDNYLVPYSNSSAKMENINNKEQINEDYNMNNLAIKIDFDIDDNEEESQHDLDENDIDYECDENIDCEDHEDLNNNQVMECENENQINVEDYYNDDNLLLIDSDFKNRNHFAVYILLGELKKIYGDSNNITYMITPIKNSFEDGIYEKLEVQKDLDDIRSSKYSNFIYFPYNLKLIELIKSSELM